MNQWLSTALSSDKQQILGIFGDDSSWSLVYNLYADLVLGTNLVPKSVRQRLLRSCSNIFTLYGQVLENHTKYLGSRLVSGTS